MAHVTLSYFDFHGGRGEDCRIALHIAGVPFEDDRIKGPDWPGRKGATPWGNLPVLTIDGKQLGQSNAVLTLIGRQHGLHPTDPWEAAGHESVMAAVEELRQKQAALPSSEPEKKEAREKFANGFLQHWAANVSNHVHGPFLAGDKLNVADLKLYVAVAFYMGGGVDHVPGTIFDDHPKIVALVEAVKAHPGVQSWMRATGR